MEFLTLAPGSDRIPVELFQILKDDAVVSAALKIQYALNKKYAGSQHLLSLETNMEFLDTTLDEVYFPGSDSRAMPSSPSQLEWKIGLPWANTRGVLNSPIKLENLAATREKSRGSPVIAR